MYFYSFLISFILTIVFLVFFIPVLRYIKCGQIVRIDGPREHYKKSGTPTMGGLIITVSFTIVFLIINAIYIKANIVTIMLLLLPVYLYMLIGFIDDYIIVVKKNNKGISPKMKILLQIIGVAIYYFLLKKADLGTTVNLYFMTVDLKWGYGVLVLLMFVSSSNAVNITDGIDGLATGLMIIALLGIGIIAYYKQNQIVLIFIITVIAGLMGFMIYNANPAKIFMGNTGSMMLGAIIANLMILLEEELLLMLIAVVFIIETLSVIMQVTYFKMTKGKRIFLMSPLHHHFEKKGFSEWKVDGLFWLIGLIAMAITILVVLI